MALTLGTDGNFYGTALGGGTTRYGGVFKITPGGKLTVLYGFKGTPDGQTPKGAIIQANDGNFYGTTEAGGANGFGSIYKMTPAGALTILHSFSETDGLGLDPLAGLVQATDGKFYGAAGSNYSSGVIFQITSTASTGSSLQPYEHYWQVSGRESASLPVPAHQRHSLRRHLRRRHREAVFLRRVYSLGMRLGPFVSFVGPLFEGKVGKTIEILGQGFTGTTKVSFHGVAATFLGGLRHLSDRSGSSRCDHGSVTVSTPGGTLTSNRIFRVTPAILSFNPPSGPVGTQVTITGTSFTGATKVTFGGVKATTFSVDSDTQITATVPTGAKTGKIQVNDSRRNPATSATIFTVTQ